MSTARLELHVRNLDGMKRMTSLKDCQRMFGSATIVVWMASLGLGWGTWVLAEKAGTIASKTNLYDSLKASVAMGTVRHMEV